MFSQFRNAVENLAVPVRQSLDESNSNGGNARRDSVSRSNSIDSQSRSSMSMTTDSPLSNLRKSLNTQRPSSPSAPQIPRTASGTRTRTTLEDRLRAAAAARSPSPSKTSPSVAKRAISPSEVPLPESLAQSPMIEAVILDNNGEEHTLAALDTRPVSPFKETITAHQTEARSSNVELGMNVTRDSLETGSDRQEAPPGLAPEILDRSQHTDPAKLDVTTFPDSDRPKFPTGFILPAERESDIQEEPSSYMAPRKEDSQGRMGDTQEPARVQTQQDVDTSNDIASAEREEVPMNKDVSNADVEALQDRLRELEQRFLDISNSLMHLQAEKAAADLAIKEFTPLGGIHDGEALRDYLHDISSKVQVFQAEAKDLNSRLQVQESRFEDLRDTHKLESSSQSDHIQRLETQLEEAEALISASQKADTQAEGKLANKQTELEQIQKELAKVQTTAKEEEEKRVKAISLLKTVRQKLVKAEKEREDTVSELQQLKERLKGDKEKDQATQLKVETELNTKLQAKDEMISSMKTQHDKELALLRERHERELAAVKGQADLEWSALKASHDQEMSTKTAIAQSLEQTLHMTREEKNNLFDTLQVRQAELESAHSHLEVLQSQNTELRYQIREADDTIAVLKENLADLQREQQSRLQDPAPSANEVALLISTTEAKYDNKLQEMRRNFTSLERERDETDAEWSRKLDEKVREAEELKKLAGSAATLTEHHKEIVMQLEEQITKLRTECKLFQQQLADSQQSSMAAQEVEKNWRSQAQEWDDKVTALEQQLEGAKLRENQLTAGNKTLREEMKKIQSSAAILERQRSPGIGLWAARTAENNGNASQVSVAMLAAESQSRPASPVPPAPKRLTDDQEVNLEYLRNVIFQFLEHKEMRPNLVRILSTILHFTPQETRRLIAKV